MTEQDLTEAREVHQQAHSWIDTMLVAGISEGVAVTGTLQALIERALLSGGTPKTAKWLRDQARQVEKTGDELLAALGRV